MKLFTWKLFYMTEIIILMFLLFLISKNLKKVLKIVFFSVFVIQRGIQYIHKKFPLLAHKDSNEDLNEDSNQDRNQESFQKKF